ncbi:MAG TPA: iron-containing alcohol dehydrogenase [Bradyrhizobium sp.]|nr:iron-containing alcohol dehydrogenase [Bradyrhizobium sp.]
MTLIGYLTRTHFAEAAIEDALPEEMGPLPSALALVDDEPASAAVCTRVQESLDQTTLSLARVGQATSAGDATSRILDALSDIRTTTLIAVGGSAALGHARLVAEHALRRGERLSLIAVPAGLCDFGLARRVRVGQREPVSCPRPDRVIADPTVLEGFPSHHLAASAMEVLVRAIEAYASPIYHPPADALALEGAKRLTHWLPMALASPGNREAQRELMAAALTAGLALEKAVGGVDALAHPIKAELGPGVLHGDLHAPLMAAMADFNTEAVGDRYATLAEAFATATREPSFSTEFGVFARAIGMPTSLREIGIDPSRFDRFAEMAANDPGALANPRRLTPGDCRRILEAAW